MNLRNKKKETTINVLKEHYLWIHQRIGDFGIAINDKFTFSSEGLALKKNQIVCNLRADFMSRFNVQKKESDKIVLAVFGHLITLAKKELTK